MAERVARYYAGLDDSESEYFAELDANQDYQYMPGYPPEVQDAAGFVPYKTLAWNRIEELTLAIGSSVSFGLNFYSRAYGPATSNMYLDVWKGDSEAGSSESGESSEETDQQKYSAVVTFYDYTTFTAEVTVTYGNGTTKVFSTGGNVQEGELALTLTEDGVVAGETLSAMLTTTPVLTVEGEDDLRYYAVYAKTEKTHVVKYWWYDENAALHEEFHTVADGEGFPEPGGTLPSMDGWTGAWVPEGPDGSDVVTNDISCEYVLTSGDGIKLKLDWRLSGGTGTEEVTGFKWCHPFPALSEKRLEEGKTLQGIYLVRDGGSDDAESEEFQARRVYNTAADPCAPLKVRIDLGGYMLVAKWMSSAAFVSDIAELRSLVGVLPSTFATLGTARAEFLSRASDVDANYKTGFPSPFEMPLPDGKVITRQMVNKIGNLGTQAQFFEQCGGYYTFDKGFCDEIGGYPKGALLQFFQESTNSLRTVRSLKEDNKVNFIEEGVDGINWAFADDSPVVSVKVDYSDYEDLSERLFVETGIPDLYEVPYDSYLQAFAVGSVDCDSLRRSPAEDVVNEYDDAYSMVKYPVHINGLYFADGQGSSFLDIYHGESQAFGSFLIGGFHPKTLLVWGGGLKLHHAVRTCPLSAFSCGIFLSKGDKIRVRNVITEKNGIVEFPSGRNNFVHPMTHGDETMRRKYNYRFAALYRRGVVP